MEVGRTLILFLNLVFVVTSYKILMVFNFPAKSHYFLGNILARGLVNAGHEITMVSPYEEKNPPKNGSYKDIILTGIMEALEGHGYPNWTKAGEANPISTVLTLNSAGYFITNFTLSHPNFQKLLSSNEKFDVIILEQFVNDGLKFLSCYYKIPLIAFSTLGPTTWTNFLVGNPASPSYIPDFLLSYTNKMSIWQRSLNLLVVIFKYVSVNLQFFPQQEALIKQHFPKSDCDASKYFYDISLILLNSHESVNDPVPLVPNMIPIGGFHVKDPKKLPNDLQTYLDEAKYGVIYFSLGSNVRSSDIGNYTKKIFMQAFGKLKQRVLWKWDEGSPSGKPGNVKTEKWLPQQDILAHPNVKLFITHGGLLSIIEAVHHEIPLLAIPIFGDQGLNAAKIEDHGYGLSLPINKVTVDNLIEVVTKLLTSSQFKDNIKLKSALIRDRNMKPMDLAIYWVEYIIRHKGALHLRTGGVNMSWYQYFFIDVLAIAIFVFFILFMTVYYFLCKSYKKTYKIKIN